MKKIFCLVFILIIILSFTGCGNITNEQLSQIENLDSKTLIDTIKEKYEVEYTGNDIEYNLSNMKDKKFVIIGVSTLSDYYGYGFNHTEEKLFCVKVKPVLDTSKEDWYIYLDREYWDDYYQALIKEGSIKKTVFICEIPSLYYQDGQGQMAYGNGAYWN